MADVPMLESLRIRTGDDLAFVRPGLADEVVVNANQLENGAEHAAAALRQGGLPFMVDPVLWRFQEPSWWRNSKGVTKRNYRRLAASYTRGTDVDFSSGPLASSVSSSDGWDRIAANASDYQLTRLAMLADQMELFASTSHRPLTPARVIAPSLVAYSTIEDRINQRLLRATINSTDAQVVAQVVAPLSRLLEPGEIDRLSESVLTSDVAAFSVWTPGVPEELLVADDRIFGSVLRLIRRLASRGIPVLHQHAGYAVMALRRIGVAGVTVSTAWIDHGEPAREPGFMTRSCQTYVTGLRHPLHFDQAAGIGRHRPPSAYVRDYCECDFCVGSFDAGEHPLDLLLEDHLIVVNGRQRRTPTSRSVAANQWHYLLSRRNEVLSFNAGPAEDVIRRDIERAGRLHDAGHLARLGELVSSVK